MTELAKTFEPGAIEARWYAHWESEGRFRPDQADAVPYTIVMPPPNVTGSLHIGHALDVTLQDILIRHARMQGKDALWVVGTDHAGIATQMVVERQLEAEGKTRSDFTRDEFIAKVWEWKAESGGQITRQLRRLGASCDWANERFTMDEGFSKAVTHVFVELHKRGLLYRDKRLVNWDPHFQTAISDLEVETRDVAGKFWTLRYPLTDGSGHVEVATTRPETMLADMAVAVHPDDVRYTALVGKMVTLPITGRLIPIVADEHADPELGSGAVKITPGHDFNDFEVGKRAGIRPADMLNMLDAGGKVAQTADGLIPAGLIGFDRFDARKKIVELLDGAGALVKVEDRQIATPYGDRSGVVIEPWLTDQWYVDAATLAKPAIEAVRSGEIRIVPETWAKTWFNWLENIQPWCVSRQLWWGHRIPAWFGPKRDESGIFVAATADAPAFAETRQIRAILDKQPFVGECEGDALQQAREYYGDGVEVVIGDGVFDQQRVSIVRDPDVLDTWFSSALWPFATLGWPDTENPPRNGEGDQVKLGGGVALDANDVDGGSRPLHQPSAGPPPRSGEELARHYPNDVLISGFDILFFWDARMAMQGIEFMKEVPWKTLYLHGLVRDAAGAKMSKSKGNTIDPLGLIDRYGADALRFTMAAMESQGRDIKLDEKRVEGYRNFATKLWNAARFLQMNGVGASASIAAPSAQLPVNRWIIGEVVATLAKLDKAFAELRFDDMADAIYHFTWGSFCDWYVELVKGAFDDETKRVAAWAFDQILVMLHPFMPFVTEELWHAMGERPYDLIVAKWPEPAAITDVTARTELAWVIEFVDQVRAARTELGIPPAIMLEIYNLGADNRMERYWMAISRLARLRLPTKLPSDCDPGKSIQISIDGSDFLIPLGDAIDFNAERARLAKAVAAAEKERESLKSRLANPAFTERAKPEAVEKARADHEAKSSEAERLRAALERLG